MEPYITVELTEDEIEALLKALKHVEMDYTVLGVAKLRLFQAVR